MVKTGLQERVNKVEVDLYKIESDLSLHEAVCAARWLETINSIKRLEWILIVCSMGVMGFLARIAITV